MATVDKKLDIIIGNLSELSAKFDRLEAKVSTLQAVSDSHGAAIAGLEKEVKLLKEAGNLRDQQSRNTVIRIFNLPVSEGESTDGNKGLSSKVYDRVLKPVLAAAKTKGDIAVLPQAGTVIEDCFRTRAAAASGGVAPVIVKLANSKMKTVILRNKRDNIPAPSRAEAAAGALPAFMVEDLTPATHQKMMEIKQDRRIAKIWTVEGQIRYTLVTSPNKILKVRSVFDSVESILG